MAKKLKKTKPEKPGPQNLKPEKEEKINLKQLAKDERTRKITGTIFLLIAVFLFVSFLSYFFTWKEDQSYVFRGEFSVLFDNDVKVNNILGRLGAITSHLFIYKWFGIASLLFCTFFFVVGANLLLVKKYFSVWRNLKYVTVGLLVLSVSLAFVFYRAEFPFGGGTGKSIADWLTGMLGNFGAGALLLVTFFAYVIWQFNPSFDLPKKKTIIPSATDLQEDDAVLIPVKEDIAVKPEEENKKNNGLKKKKEV
ncbi:MAG: DNA translocase FtsK 4TM domain-containing protein, partial [Chitinophagaceae bacterium]|nr:DNA translocase FtsK 4TM domain-containing protein [Chitinophagaceae bacterium]